MTSMPTGPVPLFVVPVMVVLPLVDPTSTAPRICTPRTLLPVPCPRPVSETVPEFDLMVVRYIVASMPDEAPPARRMPWLGDPLPLGLVPDTVTLPVPVASIDAPLYICKPKLL